MFQSNNMYKYTWSSYTLMATIRMCIAYIKINWIMEVTPPRHIVVFPCRRLLFCCTALKPLPTMPDKAIQQPPQAPRHGWLATRNLGGNEKALACPPELCKVLRAVRAPCVLYYCCCYKILARTVGSQGVQWAVIV